jgi:hypothetical protein
VVEKMVTMPNISGLVAAVEGMAAKAATAGATCDQSGKWCSSDAADRQFSQRALGHRLAFSTSFLWSTPLIVVAIVWS